jgi:two-component system cell cycle response regulator
MPSREEILNAKILVVDDCVDNLTLLVDILDEAGYTAITATTDPSKVCSLHESTNFDLIILDLQMPGMNGFQVMEGLKELEKDGYLPVLALTAEPAYKIKALEAGAKDFISKPFDMMEVDKRIQNMLEVRLLYKELAEYSKAQEALALHDVLTGLPNRRLLEDRLASAIQNARRHHRKAGVMYLDLDGFKNVNDTFGHAYGDKLLKMASERLVGISRKVDTVARIGGDEFVIVLADVARVIDVYAPAAKMVEVISSPFIVEGQELKVSASIGISVYPDHAETVDDLTHAADEALYAAKRAGKNCFRLATPVPTADAYYKTNA